MNASTWFYSLPGLHDVTPAPVAAPAQPKTTVVERWEDGRWVEHELTWDGEKYTEVK